MRTSGRIIVAISCAFVCAPAHAATLLGVHFDSGELYEVSTANAALTVIGNTGVPHLAEIEFAPDGKLYGFTTGPSATLYRAIGVGDIRPRVLAPP